MCVPHLAKFESSLPIVYFPTTANPKISPWRGASGVKGLDLCHHLFSFQKLFLLDPILSPVGPLNFTLCFVHDCCCDNFSLFHSVAVSRFCKNIRCSIYIYLAGPRKHRTTRDVDGTNAMVLIADSIMLRRKSSYNLCGLFALERDIKNGVPRGR
jgi:hypothetical protein